MGNSYFQSFHFTKLYPTFVDSALCLFGNTILSLGFVQFLLKITLHLFFIAKILNLYDFFSYVLWEIWSILRGLYFCRFERNLFHQNKWWTRTPTVCCMENKNSLKVIIISLISIFIFYNINKCNHDIWTNITKQLILRGFKVIIRWDFKYSKQYLL